METQLSYPIIGWFRSHNVNQNWLAALTTVVDTCAFSIAYAPSTSLGAEMTFAIGCHALADLAFSYRTYEKYAVAIAERLALALPGWLPGEDAVEYWRLAGAHNQRGGAHA